MNIGLCRKTSTGVMCPSYMATRDEEHSTRGRANALVKALSLPDPTAALGDERLHGILDLCLECKACKSECPLGVDMAALKTEALAAYHDQHGIPLRSRVFGSIRTLNRLGSAAFPLSNLVGRWRPGRLMAERWLGVSAAPAAAPVPAGKTCAAGTGRRPAPAPRQRPRASWSSWPTRSPPSPSPRSPARPSNSWNSPGGRSASRARAAAAGPACPRGWSTRRGGWRRAWSIAWLRRPPAACRSSGSSRPAC